MNDSFTDKQKTLREIILRLHKGEGVEGAKKDFSKLIKTVSPEEITGLETSLMEDGIRPEEIQKLCEVHVEVFEASLKKQKKASSLPGHPLHTYILENREGRTILQTLKGLMNRLEKTGDNEGKGRFEAEFARLKSINLHYLRKENQLFPKLEAAGFSAPLKVMWGKHDEIRGILKEVETHVSKNMFGKATETLSQASEKIKKMFFMEERILFPMALKKLTDNDWAAIRNEEPQIGYAWVKPGNMWDSNIILNRDEFQKRPSAASEILLAEGRLTPQQIDLMLTNLPLDITYVDENDTVLYYSANRERIFPRSPAIIGRKVQNCHPPKSVHVVEGILRDFREKKRTSAEFHIPFNDMFVHIRYFPLYDAEGRYCGVIEMTQDIKEIQTLKGEKRLLD